MCIPLGEKPSDYGNSSLARTCECVRWKFSEGGGVEKKHLWIFSHIFYMKMIMGQFLSLS